MGSVGTNRESGVPQSGKKQPTRLSFLEDRAASESLGDYAEMRYGIGVTDLNDDDYDRIVNEFDSYRQGFESFVNEYVNNPDNEIDMWNMSDSDYRALRRKLAKMYDSRNNIR